MDYIKVAEGFGAKGFRCETINEFENAFEERQIFVSTVTQNQ